MKLKHAKWALDAIEGFKSPKIKYEQYMTPSELACSVAHVMAVENDDVLGKSIIDLGCGTGMLSAAMLLYGANQVVGIDVDSSLEHIYKENLAKVSDKPYKFINIDVTTSDISTIGKYHTAIINPPFGTKNTSGVDVLFLDKALQIADVVYSIHKTSTRDYFKEKYAGRIKILSKMYFELKKTYRFHKKESVHVEVDLIRVSNI